MAEVRYDQQIHEPPCQNQRGFRANNDHNYFFSSFKLFGFKYTTNFAMNKKKMTDVNEMTRGLDIEYGVFRRSKLPQMSLRFYKEV